MSNQKTLKTIAKRYLLAEIHDIHPQDYWPNPDSLLFNVSARDTYAAHGIIKQREVYLARRLMKVANSNGKERVADLAICMTRSSRDIHPALIFNNKNQWAIDLLQNYALEAHRGWKPTSSLDFLVLTSGHLDDLNAHTAVMNHGLAVNLELTSGFETYFCEFNDQSLYLESLFESLISTLQ